MPEGPEGETPAGHDLFLVRHGATAWSRAGRHTGRTDVPLLEEGRDQARALAPVLAAHRFSLVLTSPLLRAKETCALAGLGDRAQVTDDLVEWDYGDYEGLTTDEIRLERPGWTLWADGVPGGETVGAVGRRADRVIEAARAAAGTPSASRTGTSCGRWRPAGRGSPPSAAGSSPSTPPRSACSAGNGRCRCSCVGTSQARRASGQRPAGGGGRRRAPGLVDHVGEREGLQMGAHALADLGPHGEQDALALVVAGPARVGLPEVARHDGAVDGRDDLGEGDVLGRPRQHVAAPDATLGAHEAGPLQGEQDLLQVGLGKSRAVGDVAHRGRRALGTAQGEGEQGPAGIVATRGHLHASMLPGGAAGTAPRRLRPVGCSP